MNIALVVEASGGGTGTHVAGLARGFVERGHSVHILYSPMRADGRFQAAIASMRQLHGFHAQPVNISHNPHPSDAGVVLALAAYLRKHGPFDTVHCHSTKAGLVGRLAAMLCRTPSVYTPHGILSRDPSAPRMKRRITAVLERTLGRRSNAIVAVSDVEREHIVEIGISPKRVVLIPNGIDATAQPPLSLREQVRTRFGLQPEDPCVGFIGRFVVQKSPDVLLKAFAQVHKNIPRARLMLVGGGPLQSEMIRLAKELQIDQSVIWCGERDAAGFVPAFDMLALSSCSESLPYVVLEAMVAGLPVVATDVGGLRMMVTPGVNGMLVPVGDSSRLGGALLALCADSRLRSEMGAHSLSAAAEFSLDRMIGRLETLYRTHSNLEHEIAKESRNSVKAAQRAARSIQIEQEI